MPTWFWILLAVIWIALAFWPARVAGRKGHSFFGYFILSLFFFPLALILAYVVQDRSAPRPTAHDRASVDVRTNPGKATTMTTPASRRYSRLDKAVHLTPLGAGAAGKAARAQVPRSSHAMFDPRPAARIRSICWSPRRPAGYRNWCRCGTGGCWSRRSPSTVARRC